MFLIFSADFADFWAFKNLENLWKMRNTLCFRIKFCVFVDLSDFLQHVVVGGRVGSAGWLVGSARGWLAGWMDANSCKNLKNLVNLQKKRI